MKINIRHIKFCTFLIYSETVKSKIVKENVIRVIPFAMMVRKIAEGMQVGQWQFTMKYQNHIMTSEYF